MKKKDQMDDLQLQIAQLQKRVAELEERFVNGVTPIEDK